MTKTELLQVLAANRDRLLDSLTGLSEEQLTTVPILDEWTIQDIVGHIAYWEGVILDHVREAYAEGRPRPVRDNETDDVVNPREVARRKQRPWARVQEEFIHVRAALIGKVESLSELDLSFQVPNPWENQKGFYSVAQMIHEDAVGHCREHTEQILGWKSKSAGGGTPG